MELDIVFNIDYPSKLKVEPLYLNIPKYIEYIEVKNMDQFRRIVNCLNDEVVSYIWLHPSFSGDQVDAGFESRVTTEVLPELKELNIEVTQITRSTGKTSEKDFFDVGKMLDVKKTKKGYTTEELKEVLNSKPKTATLENKPRLRIEQSLKEEIKLINSRIRELRNFLHVSYSEDAGYWFQKIFKIEDIYTERCFNNSYWQFNIGNYKLYLNLNNLEECMIDPDHMNVAEIIKFDVDNRRWLIDMSFFDEVSKRFEQQDPDNSSEKLAVATTLYVIHEAIHKIHNLDCNTVAGIGNFPKIIEEADYQADSIAILTEFSFYIHQMGGIEKMSANQLIDKLCSTIEIAIQTTFSFNPIQDALKLIQVRRVNRYLIWFYHYFKIKNLKAENLDATSTIKEILTYFSHKPLIEVSGPAIKSNKDMDRTFYDLNRIKHQEEIAILKMNNEIIRMGKIQSVDFSQFYTGIKESNFEKMRDFLNVIFTNNRAALK
ncbi:hypothetical protein [Pedobacter psychroterrae]|uniref:Uncharacterized protein n=1 Tax=Pedobacter psychroterrae TaxID=2530453 RepID=A0A4V6N602_9SPHI|nr:hypothetical protein [Pedobacter psychroterrae]TCC99976.1 hypothetical protein EZ437_17200 [Pedobacter psychroterrae]